MTIRQQWIASSLVMLWLGSTLLAGIAFAETHAAGKKVYRKRCQSCHAADGSGNHKMAKLLKVSIPPLTGTALEQQNDAEILNIIAKGKGKMPGYAKTLSTEERRQVLEYVKTLGR